MKIYEEKDLYYAAVNMLRSIEKCPEIFKTLTLNEKDRITSLFCLMWEKCIEPFEEADEAEFIIRSSALNSLFHGRLKAMLNLQMKNFASFSI
jgi:hypothetical protein